MRFTQQINANQRRRPFPFEKKNFELQPSAVKMIYTICEIDRSKSPASDTILINVFLKLNVTFIIAPCPVQPRVRLLPNKFAKS